MLFKQETAYEMRISDWSSDVCSSDLTIIIEYIDRKAPEPGLIPADPDAALKVRLFDRIFDLHVMAPMQEVVGDALRGPENHLPVIVDKARSEEHTSELQSLMRISYAVFCLKKKKHENKI